MRAILLALLLGGCGQGAAVSDFYLGRCFETPSVRHAWQPVGHWIVEIE